MTKKLSEELLAAYKNSCYNVFLGETVVSLKVGTISNELSIFLKDLQIKSASFITAFNPNSVVLSEEENANRNRDLLADISSLKLSYYEGIGFDEINKDWLPEKHFLVLGIDRKQSMNLAKKYNQNAILFIVDDGFVELLITI